MPSGTSRSCTTSFSRERSCARGDLAADAAAARGVGHQHGVAAGQRQVGGQRRALVAALFLDDLHQHHLAALDDFLDLVLAARTEGALRHFLQHVVAADGFDDFLFGVVARRLHRRACSSPCGAAAVLVVRRRRIRRRHARHAARRRHGPRFRARAPRRAVRHARARRGVPARRCGGARRPRPAAAIGSAALRRRFARGMIVARDRHGHDHDRGHDRAHDRDHAWS